MASFYQCVSSNEDVMEKRLRRDDAILVMHREVVVGVSAGEGRPMSWICTDRYRGRRITRATATSRVAVCTIDYSTVCSVC